MRNDFETVMKTSSLHFSFGEVFLRSAKSKQACIPLSLSANSLCFVSFIFSGRRKKERNEGKNFYYHTNHLGSTAYVTDNNATITQGFLYAPFGEITTEYNANFYNNVLPKYSFNAKELDEETGMYYYEARYYKPPVFTSRYPMFEKYFWMTPYAYCANNPVKYVDPSGKEGEVSDLILADQTNKTNYTELLVSSLSKLTGISISTETRNNGRTFLTYAKDANGNPIVENDANGKPIGSQTAREMVIQLIDNKDIVNISRSGKGSAVPPNSNQIKLDFDQIERYMNGVQGGLNPETMGYGMVFLHEFSHTLIGGNMSDTPGTPGPVVEKINAIRAELNEQGGNYGQRMNYYSTLINGRNYLPFDVTSMKFLKIGQISGGCKYIEF